MVGCGGFIGAVLRYLVSLGTQRLLGTPLYATLTVNVVGLNLPHPTPIAKDDHFTYNRGIERVQYRQL